MKTYILGFLGLENIHIWCLFLDSGSSSQKKSKMAATHGFCQLDEGLG